MAINVMDVNWWPESEYHEIQKKGHPGNLLYCSLLVQPSRLTLNITNTPESVSN